MNTYDRIPDKNIVLVQLQNEMLYSPPDRLQALVVVWSGDGLASRARRAGRRSSPASAAALSVLGLSWACCTGRR